MECKIGDKSAPLSELDRHLRSHFDDIYHIHPRKLEELVCAIFRDHGHAAQLRAHTKDGGIDLLLFTKRDEAPTAVQVKRYRRDRKIGVEEVHQFIGAIMANGIQRGLYVTTSSFTKGARLLPSNAFLRNCGVELELMDSQAFLDIFSNRSHIPVDPWNVAWGLRKNIPMEMDVPGDWYGSEHWPMIPPSGFQVEWWTNKYRNRIMQEPSTASHLSIPRSLSRSEILSALALVSSHKYVDVSYLSDNRTNIAHSIKQVSPESTNPDGWLHWDGVVDIRRWNPVSGYEVVHGGSEIGQRPASANEFEVRIVDPIECWGVDKVPP